MTPVPTSELAALVERAQRLWRWDTTAVIVLGVVLGPSAWMTFSEGKIAIGIIMIAVIIGVWWLANDWEWRRRLVTIDYHDSDSTERAKHDRIKAAVGQLGAARGLWSVRDRFSLSANAANKGNAGAGTIIGRSTLRLSKQEPPWVQTNADPPNLICADWHATFLPDGLLVVSGKHAYYGKYSQVQVVCGQTKFIEASPPSDATVVGKTWTYVNKNGAPDRRYASNPEQSICLFGEITIQMPGVMLKMHVSNHFIGESAGQSVASAIR